MTNPPPPLPFIIPDSAFRFCCRARAEKLEKNSIVYGCLSRICADGGIKIALIARYSAIPPHCKRNKTHSLFTHFLIFFSHSSDIPYFHTLVTTAVFSVCGMNILVFIAAAVLSLPKQFITVYIGVVLEDESTGELSSLSPPFSGIGYGIIADNAADW